MNNFKEMFLSIFVFFIAGWIGVLPIGVVCMLQTPYDSLGFNEWSLIILGSILITLFWFVIPISLYLDYKKNKYVNN